MEVPSGRFWPPWAHSRFTETMWLIAWPQLDASCLRAELRCAALRCAALRCAALRCPALRCAALHAPT
eukprot:2830550-Alexandrium_andersonii.AAC.1